MSLSVVAVQKYMYMYFVTYACGSFGNYGLTIKAQLRKRRLKYMKTLTKSSWSPNKQEITKHTRDTCTWKWWRNSTNALSITCSSMRNSTRPVYDKCGSYDSKTPFIYRISNASDTCHKFITRYRVNDVQRLLLKLYFRRISYKLSSDRVSVRRYWTTFKEGKN